MGWTHVKPPGDQLYPSATTWPGALTFTGTMLYPEILLEWAPTTQPTDAVQAWEDITDRLREWSWGYGRSDELGRFEAGTGSLILNNRDRQLDPSFDAGGWFGKIKPRRMFRLRYRWGGTIYPGFVAYARGFPQTYPAAGNDSLVKVDLVDAFAILQGVDLVVGFTRPVEDSGAQVAAVLDAVGVPSDLRAIDVGTVQVDAINVTDSGTSGLDRAKAVVADAEAGQLFVAKDGKVTVHNRHERLNATSLHTFTDDPAGDLRYGEGIEPAFDETYLWNYVRVTNGDESSVAEDTASQDDYFTITKQISTPLAYEPDRTALAEHQVLRYSQPELRAPQLPLQGAVNPNAMWPVILDLEVSDRITVERFSLIPDPMILTQNVEGIRHSCRPGGPWTTTVATSPADTTLYWRLEDATTGKIDGPYGLAA